MKSIKIKGLATYPSKIVCVGRNYVAHIEELGNDMPDSMVVFNKPNSAITDILHSHIDDQSLHYESELRQEGGVDLMIYKPDDIIRELATFTTLEDGDIIMTGTPAGVGEIRAGQRFEGQVLLSGKPLVSATWIAR